MALTDKLSAVGNAIRVKTGKTALLTLDEMPAEIASIQTGGGGGSATDGNAYIVITRTMEVSNSSQGSYQAWSIDLSDYISDLSQIVSISTSGSTSSNGIYGYWHRDFLDENGYFDFWKSSTFYPREGTRAGTLKWLPNPMTGDTSTTTLIFQKNWSMNMYINKIVIRYNTEV